MSIEPVECAGEASTTLEEPATPDHLSEAKVDLPYRISVEHCYSRLVPFRSSPPPCSLTRDASFPTSILFANRVSDKSQLEALNRKWARKPIHETSVGMDSDGYVNGRRSTVQNGVDKDDSDTDSGEDEDLPVDIMSVDPIPDLPYDEKKVSSIMVECSRHINLVKVPAENSDLLLSKAIQEASHHRRILLRRLVDVLEAGHLARLACTGSPHEPIKRRLNTDKAARQFRKALADVHWDVKLTRFCHETLLQVLNSDLLPIYLDILQVLKAKCPVLVENMIHSSIGLVGNEAFGLLLKRPWNPAVGLHTIEKQIRFDPAPLFVSLPYSTCGLGGRRWRMLQSHLSVIGKVYPVIVPEKVTDGVHGSSLEDVAELMITTSIARVQELQSQHPARPIVLVGFSIAGRIAATVAEIEPVGCIVSLGLPAIGPDTTWSVNSDPFKECKTPTIFVTGSESNVCSVEYAENLRSEMKCSTSLVVVGGGDDLLRLSAEDKAAETVCQSIVDRCIFDKIYEFMVYSLPCVYPEEQARLPRKRKSSHTEDIGSAFLTPAVTQSPIRLSSPTEDLPVDGKNVNYNNSNPTSKTYMSLKQGRSSPVVDSRSCTPSPVLLLEKKLPSTGLTSKRKAFCAPELPKVGRPRSRSISEKPKRRGSLRLRSNSSDQTNGHSVFGSLAINSVPEKVLSLNSNSNNSNNYINVSPPGLLSIPQAHIRPLPITPPRNPFEDIQGITSHKLDPKTLKQLQKGN